MPYRYILKWKRGYEESITIEAWPKTKELALPNENRRPSFTIGRLKGSRTIMLRQQMEEAISTYGCRKRGTTISIHFPKDDIPAIATAYRIGLAAGVLTGIRNSKAIEHAYQYVMSATQEEIWFWASKMLGVIDRAPRKRSVIKALATLAHP